MFAATAQDAAALHYPMPEGVTDAPTDEPRRVLAGVRLLARRPRRVGRSCLRRPSCGATSALLVAVADGAAVGSAIMRWVDATGYLGGIGVRPDLRGRGIGGALTAEATPGSPRGPAR